MALFRRPLAGCPSRWIMSNKFCWLNWAISPQHHEVHTFLTGTLSSSKILNFFIHLFFWMMNRSRSKLLHPNTQHFHIPFLDVRGGSTIFLRRAIVHLMNVTWATNDPQNGWLIEKNYFWDYLKMHDVQCTVCISQDIQAGSLSQFMKLVAKQTNAFCKPLPCHPAPLCDHPITVATSTPSQKPSDSLHFQSNDFWHKPGFWPKISNKTVLLLQFRSNFRII